MKAVVHLLVAISILSSACSSTTIIRSTDPNSKVYVDGEFRGIGETRQMDTKTVFASTAVRIEKPGCKERRFELPKAQEFQVGPFIGGLFLLVPFLWVSGYRPENTFEYSCVK
jgi:hypothetical protein